MKNFVITRSPLTVAVILLALFSVGSVSAHNQEIAKLNRFVQSNKGNTASMQVFREGRDFIEQQNWQKAAEKFNDFIKGYPKDRDLDAALYWYGYALEKQGRKDEATTQLKRLVDRFPGSTWRREAIALMVSMGNTGYPQEVQLRDNCEIKILALQSLYQADEERALSIITETLKANPSPCQGLQAAAVSILGSRRSPRAIPILLDIARTNPDLKLRLTAIRQLGDQHDEQVTEELIKIYDADRTKEVRSQILRALVESRTPRGSAKVIEIARASDDPSARMFAVRYLGQLKDPVSLEALISIYDADKTMETRSQILRTLSERDEPRALAKIWEIARTGETPEIRLTAIRQLGNSNRIGIDELLQLYSSEQNPQIKQGLLRAFSESNDPKATAKLFEIARGNDPVELRGYAIRVLSHKNDSTITEQFVTMYDAEQNDQFKNMLLRAFGESQQKSAVRKLMSIARNDSSVERRKLAVRYLGQSRDPEAMKFLEDLLK